MSLEVASADQIRELLTAPMAAAGVELVEVCWRPHGRQRRLLVTVDRPGGITLDECGTVSRAISALLDAADPVPGPYLLEVSSPGIERPFQGEMDWERAVGHRVRLRHRDGDAETVLEGRLLELGPTEVLLEVRLGRGRSERRAVTRETVVLAHRVVDL